MKFQMSHMIIFVLAILVTKMPAFRAQYGPSSPSSSSSSSLPFPFSSSSSSPSSSSSSSPSSSSSSSPSSSSSSSSSSCVNSLVPCLNYLNTTDNPPNSCCDPLRLVVKSDQQCLCQLISTQGTFQAQLMGLNISQLEMLPERCGQRVNPLACLKGSTRNSVQNSASFRSFSFRMLIVSIAVSFVIVS